MDTCAGSHDILNAGFIQLSDTITEGSSRVDDTL